MCEGLARADARGTVVLSLSRNPAAVIHLLQFVPEVQQDIHLHFFPIQSEEFKEQELEWSMD